MDRTDRNFLIGAGLAAAATAGIVFLLADRKKSGGESNHGYSVLLNCREPLYGNRFFEVTDNAAWQVYQNETIEEVANAAINQAIQRAAASGGELGKNSEPVSSKEVASEVWGRLFPECGQPDQEGRDDLSDYFRVVCENVVATLEGKYKLELSESGGDYLRWSYTEDC